MAGSVNLVVLIGNLGRDPEVKFIDSGSAVCSFSIACDEEWKDKQGEKQKRTEWVRVVAWGKLAELCGEYLAKGRQCYVEGSLQTRKWQDKEGKDRYTTEVKAREVTFLGGKPAGESSDSDPGPAGDGTPF